MKFIPNENCTVASGACFNAGRCTGRCKPANNIKLLDKPRHLPGDVPARLRQLADDVEQGRVTAMAVGYVIDGGYEFMWPSSLVDSLTLASLMQASAVAKFRE